MTSSLPLLDPILENKLRSKYNLLDVINLMEYDHDMSLLSSRLEGQRRDMFDAFDRFVIVHFDVDYYFHGHGFTINNLINLWKSLDIPMYTMVLYTNHIGISKEVQTLCCQQNSLDMPTVIESIVDPVNYNQSQYQDVDFDIDSLQLHCICMMSGTPRSHRKATYHHLQHLVDSKIAMSVKAST